MALTARRGAPGGAYQWRHKLDRSKFFTNQDGEFFLPSHQVMAEIVVRETRDMVRFVPGLALPGGLSGRFVIRDEATNRWLSDEAAHTSVVSWVSEILGGLSEALDLTPGNRRMGESTGNLNSVVNRLAATRQDLHRPLDQWDEYPELLQAPASVWDLRHGTRRDTTAMDFHLLSALVEPDAAVPIPKFLNVLDTMFAGSLADLAHFKDRIGSGLWGHNAEQKFNWIIGHSGSGKSTAFQVFVRLLGSYATVGNSGLLVRQRVGAGDMSQDGLHLANLEGRRLVLFDEIEEGHGTLRAAMFKALANGAEQLIRPLYTNPRVTRFRFSPFLLSNRMVQGGLGGDDGESIRRRIELTCADGRPAQVIDGLADQIVAEEGPGVLAWMINCAVGYHERRTSPFGSGPVEMSPLARMTVGNFTKEGTPVLDWFAERVEVTGNPKDRLHAGTLLADFETWWNSNRSHNGLEPGVSETNFFRELGVLIRGKAGTHHDGQMLIAKKRASGYSGLKLSETVNEKGEFTP